MKRRSPRPPGPLRFTVRKAASILDFLAERFPGAHRKTLRQRLAHHGVRVRGKAVTNAKQELQVGDEVEILRHAVRAEPLPEGMRVVWKDETLILIHKPAGLLSMGNDRERRKTAYWHLTDWVRGDTGNAGERIFIVHRLDQDASGLLLFARTEEAKRKLQDHWDDVEKTYAVITDGIPRPPEGTWKSRMVEKAHFRMKNRREDDAEGKEAITHYKTLASRHGFAFLEVRLVTGRKHQIRVHAASCHCPVVGDAKYGAEARDPLRRLGLHAWKLALKHPVTGKPLQFEDSLPTGFKLP